MDKNIERHSLSEWRRLRGLSQEKVGEACGVHPNTVRFWEKSPGKIPAGKVINLLQVLNIDFDQLNFFNF